MQAIPLAVRAVRDKVPCLFFLSRKQFIKQLFEA